ncbi:hypothetical protein E2553_39980 [Paraburkholderia dipogonis]|uniref:Peptidoglycan-binding protein n=1 Tax=Paraburkholderia dipogonis TaxID=1211383 RepID=A0A4Y8MJQ1_9BURK|nr:hypothetical protein [Paraburkholderia dipogonis]TFE37603.1 hypothetical protein E2553_39980 [Paraburkholderia dipogonis]
MREKITLVAFVLALSFAANAAKAAGPASEAGTIARDSDILFQLPETGQPINDGQFGFVTTFRQHLVAIAARCELSLPQQLLVPSGKFDSKTAQAIIKVAACHEVSSALPDDDAARKGAITSALWKVVVPDAPAPGLLDRVQAMTFQFEGTDYVTIEFNVGTKDLGILTWGPLGATVGQAHQVQTILREIDAQFPKLIDDAFPEESVSIRTLYRTDSDADNARLVQAVKASPTRKAAWQRGFAALGSNLDVRKIYNAAMAETGKSGLVEGIADFYCSYWAHGWVPTEVDMAFFFDRAVQTAVFQPNTNQAVGAASGVLGKSRGTPSAAERRRAVAANFILTTGWAEDRLARDVSYYVGAIPEASITEKTFVALQLKKNLVGADKGGEVAIWRKRSGFEASNFGLSDDRLAPPPTMMAKSRPKCIEPAHP